MNSSDSKLMDKAIRLQTVTVLPPWEAFLLPISVFPIPEGELDLVRRFLGRFTAALSEEWSLSSEVFLQLEQIPERESRTRFAENGRNWMPEVGLGVWPDRDPPAIWTEAEFMGGEPGKRLRPLMYQVFRITTSAKQRESARNVMLPFGPVIEVMLSGSSDAFFAKTAAALLPPIKDPSYTCFPFYLPLLEGKTLVGARSEQLDTWFASATIYIRESFEDQGILIASKNSLEPIFRKLHGEYEPALERSWRIPY